MAKSEGGRENIRDYYEGQKVDMKVAKDPDIQLESGAKDSPAMTGESKEEVDYNNYA